jgi:hypothetical protein
MPRDWLLLIHHTPSRPLYLRARVLNVIRRWGGVALKSSVYAFPRGPERERALEALVRDVRAAGGEAFLVEARFPAAEDERGIVESFRAERRRDYESVLARLDPSPAARAGRGRQASSARPVAPRLERLRERYRLIRANDPFDSPGADRVASALERLARRESGGRAGAAPAGALRDLVGRVWVTRARLHVDRLACAWLVRRLIDPRARFRTVERARADIAESEIGFDFPGARFTHERGRCSFEALLQATALPDPELQRIAEIVHDLDLGDHRYGHPETAGIGRLLDGALAGLESDEERLDRGLRFFDDLRRAFRRAPKIAGAPPRRPRA